MHNKGNKQNAILNGEWGKHVKKDEKRLTSKKRRRVGRADTEARRQEIER